MITLLEQIFDKGGIYMRIMPFMKRKRGIQFAGVGIDSGGGDTSALANKTDLTAIILTGTTNTSGNVISAGTWFYLNGTPCVAKVDIASGATFTEGTNYEEKTVGSALSELNSNIHTAVLIESVAYQETVATQWSACATFYVESYKKYGFATSWGHSKPYALGLGTENSTEPDIWVFADNTDNYQSIGFIIFPFYYMNSSRYMKLFCKREALPSGNNIFYQFLL